MYDEARRKVAGYIGASGPGSIVFTRGATEAINLVAYGIEHLLQPGDVILLTLLEHHSNIVPWQMLARRRGLRVAFTEISEHGEFDLEDFTRKLEELKPKVVAATQLSNSLGTVTPIEEIVRRASAAGAQVLVDGAQGVTHLGVNVKELGCDYYVFSGHKMYGPTGIGVLYGRPERLEALTPLLGGGDMISYVSTEGSGWAEVPQRFEAGTPAFPEAIALGAAVDFLSRFSRDELNKHEVELVKGAIDLLQQQEGITVHGPGQIGGAQTAVCSFSIDNVHPHDFATNADTYNVQIRAGNHCAMPTLKRLGVPATVRMSFGVYSCREDLESVIGAVREARKMFGR
jgi:cysteine desulfurase/selenocysteine lyase